MIEVKDLNFRIGNKTILENITLRIKKGDFVSIIGPNGAGKSTLIKMIMGILTPDTGQIRIDGIPASDWRKSGLIGYVPQKEQFDTDFPARVLDIVLLGLAGTKGLFRFFTKKDKQKAMDILDQLKIVHLAGELIGGLSGGEFQRVMLGRALITGSEYLFLDEPDANVDKSGVARFYDLLNRLNSEGKTIVMISHDVNTVTRYSNSLVCLNKTLHCHTHPELLQADVIKKTYGEVVQLIERRESE